MENRGSAPQSPRDGQRSGEGRRTRKGKSKTDPLPEASVAIEAPSSSDGSGRVLTARVAAKASGVVAKPIAAQAVAVPRASQPNAEEGPVADMEHGVEVEAGANEEANPLAPRRRKLIDLIPGWLVSLVVHVILILILAAITLDPIQNVLSILQASSGEDTETIQEFDLEAPSVDDLSAESMDQPLSPPAAAEQTVTMEEITPVMETMPTQEFSLEMNQLTESIVPSAVLQSQSMSQISSSLSTRSMTGKSEMLERYGGSAASERSVALALKWIAEHQASDGGWNFTHTHVCNGQCKNPGSMSEARNGATAMALLPFLGAGQTHMEGQYKDTVKRGLAYLVTRMQYKSGRLPHGSWWERGGRMYSHGLAAITVCEAYAMTRDPDLLQPAQLSLNYLVSAQDPRGGGWRYKPQEAGDTSVVGWCVMALKSGKMGHLTVPMKTFQGAATFLDYVSTNNGAYYGYNRPTSELDGRKATIAVGLLCRMYLGTEREHPGLQEGIKHLSDTGPKLNDLYYTYYATQVMRHHGGPMWEKWNRSLRDPLIKQQTTSGHAAGSWVASGRHARDGGRLYATSLATMILEVYYRHLPLYSDKSSDEDFEI